MLSETARQLDFSLKRKKQTKSLVYKLNLNYEAQKNKELNYVRCNIQLEYGRLNDTIIVYGNRLLS